MRFGILCRTRLLEMSQFESRVAVHPAGEGASRLPAGEPGRRRSRWLSARVQVLVTQSQSKAIMTAVSATVGEPSVLILSSAVSCPKLLFAIKIARAIGRR